MIDATAVRKAMWLRDPVLYVRQRFGAEPDPSQIEMLEALPSQEERDLRIATQSCANTGKTAGLAWASCWFMELQGDFQNHHYPNGIAASITESNLRDYYIKECSTWIARSRPVDGLPHLGQLLDLNSERLALRGYEGKAFIAFRTFPKNADANSVGATLAGLHGKYVLQVLDELGAQPKPVVRTVEQAREKDQRFFKVLGAGNPVTEDGALYEIATNLRHLWKLIVVTGDPDVATRTPRIPIEVARERIATYGRDAAWVRIYTLGLFPLTAINKFLGPDDITEAQRRHYTEADIAWSQNRLGIDPARFGDDRTGFVRRQGRVMWPSWNMRDASSSQISAYAAELNATPKVGPFDLVIVDAGGPNSGGLVDQLKQALGEARVMEVASSGKSPDPRCFNLRAYMHESAARWVKSGGQLPPFGSDESMMQEALAPMYDHKGGKIIVEEKKELKGPDRLGRSPDLWDAACLTFAVPDAPKLAAVPAGHPLAPHIRTGVVQTEFDPLGRENWR